MRWLGWTLLAVAALSLIAVIVLLATLVRNAPALLAPPGLAERLRVYLTRNVAELSPDARFPELVSPRLPMPPDQALDEVRNAMRALGWQLVDAAATDDATDNTARAGSGLSAQVRSPLLGFVDDVRVWLEPTTDGGSWLRARSRSRLGRGDLAANAAHLRRLKQALSEP